MPQKYGMYDYALNSVGFVECETPYSIVVLTSLGDKGADVMAKLIALHMNILNKVEGGLIF